MTEQKFEGEMGKKLTATTFGKKYYEEHRDAGLDYMVSGEWQHEYGRWFVESFDLKGKQVLDLGCACGAIVKGLAAAGALVRGIDINAYMIGLACGKDPSMQKVLEVGDAANLPYPAQSFDMIHCAQVAEHWDPAKVPVILGEMHRVLKPGGLVFNCLDTVELYERQGRKLEDEDPTHWCVRTRGWWELAVKYILKDVTGVWGQRLTDHPGSFLKRYDWDYFVWQRE